MNIFRPNPGDERLRYLERRAATGDRQARVELRRERLRRGLPDPMWRGATRMASQARRVSHFMDMVRDVAGQIENLMHDAEEYARDEGDDSLIMSAMAAGDALSQNVRDESPREYWQDDPLLSRLSSREADDVIDQAVNWLEDRPIRWPRGWVLGGRRR